MRRRDGLVLVGAASDPSWIEAREEGTRRGGGASAREFEAAGSTCSGTRAPWEVHERSSG